jgi:hypothetical protein
MKPETAKPSLQMHLLCPTYIVLTTTPLGFELQKFLATKGIKKTIQLFYELISKPQQKKKKKKKKKKKDTYSRRLYYNYKINLDLRRNLKQVALQVCISNLFDVSEFL